MSTNRELNLRQGLRTALVLGVLGAAAVVSPAAMAGVHFGFSVNLALPPGVHINVGNYQPYYVGRVFYQPLGVWRPVYSFPVQTPYGVAYEPYVYDGDQVICSNCIPGPDAGYGQFIVEGPGYYNPGWYLGGSIHGYYGSGGWHDHGYYGHSGGWNGHDHYYGWNQSRAYPQNGDWNRGRNWVRGGDHGGRNMDHRQSHSERGGSGGHHGRERRH
jgi:hypothetical protein